MSSQQDSMASGAVPWMTAAIAVTLVACYTALSVDLHGVFPFWHWTKFGSVIWPSTTLSPDTPDLWLRLLTTVGAAAAIALSVHLFQTRTLTGIILGGVSLRFLIDGLRPSTIDFSQRHSYFIEAIFTDLDAILGDYRAVVESALIPVYLETKPPGLLALHRLFFLGVSPIAPDLPDSFTAVMVVSYAAMAISGGALTWIVWRSAEQWGGRELAIRAALLLTITPQFLLMQFEPALRLTPLAAATLWFVGRESFTERRASACGVLWGLMLFLDWGALVMALIPAIQCLLLREPMQIVRSAGAFWGAVAAVWLPILIFTGNDYLSLFRYALDVHGRIYGIQQLSLLDRWVFALWQIAELALALGPALFVAAVRGSLSTKREHLVQLLPYLVYMLALILSGSVVSESARLWAVLTPLVTLFAAMGAKEALVFRMVAGCQAATVISYWSVGWFIA